MVDSTVYLNGLQVFSQSLLQEINGQGGERLLVLVSTFTKSQLQIQPYTDKRDQIYYDQTVSECNTDPLRH